MSRTKGGLDGIGRASPAARADKNAVTSNTYLATLLSKRATSFAASCCGCDIVRL